MHNLKSETRNLGDTKRNLWEKYRSPHLKHPEMKNIPGAKICSKSGYPKIYKSIKWVRAGAPTWGRGGDEGGQCAVSIYHSSLSKLENEKENLHIFSF